jgi:hypothetical protein
VGFPVGYLTASTAVVPANQDNGVRVFSFSFCLNSLLHTSHVDILHHDEQSHLQVRLNKRNKTEKHGKNQTISA